MSYDHGLSLGYNVVIGSGHYTGKFHHKCFQTISSHPKFSHFPPNVVSPLNSCRKILKALRFFSSLWSIKYWQKNGICRCIWIYEQRKWDFAGKRWTPWHPERNPMGTSQCRSFSGGCEQHNVGWKVLRSHGHFRPCRLSHVFRDYPKVGQYVSTALFQ